MHGEMNLSTDSLKRWPQNASIVFTGSTGGGKSSTINHFLNTVVAKTSSFEPGTRETSEYLVATNIYDDEDSDRKLSIIDTPGFNDPRGITQDACNLHSMMDFFKTHPLYSNPKSYPNLIFLVISANEDRIDGSNSKLANTLCALNELDIVDKNHPNVVAVLTFCCSVSHCNVPKWEKLMQEKKDIISCNIYQALGIQAPVVLLENDADSNDLNKDDQFTLLPNNKRQPENVYKACQKILEDNSDHCGLSTFNACLAEAINAKKQYQVVVGHKVLAKDSTNNSISEIEHVLFHTLRGAEDEQEVIINIGSGRRRRGSKTKLLDNRNGNFWLPNIKITIGVLVIWFCIIGWIAAVILVKLD